MSTNFLSHQQIYVPLVVAIGTFLVLTVLKNVVIVKLRKVSEATETYIDDLVVDVLEVTKQFFIIATALFSGFQFLQLDKTYGKIADKIFIVIFAVQGIVWVNAAVKSWIEITIQKKNNDPSIRTTLGFVGVLLKFGLIAIVLLFTLNNLGVNVSTFVTGLGVGGIAIALATQNILGDLFSSLSIVLDKPFVVGDFISLGEWMGTVEFIGLKTTRLRSLSGEQIVVSNSDLLSTKIRNFKRMQERRVLFTLGVTYSTKREALKKAPQLIEKVITSYPNTRFDRAHFLNYGAYSLDIHVVYYVLSAEYNDYADLHQKILLDIHEEFEANELDFAFPTQSVIVEKKEA